VKRLGLASLKAFPSNHATISPHIATKSLNAARILQIEAAVQQNFLPNTYDPSQKK